MNRPSYRMRNNARAAFTLIEILVVVVILGILAAGVLSKVIGETDKAKVARATTDVEKLSSDLERFYLDMGRYPTTEEGLLGLTTAPEDDQDAKWKGPYVTKLATDPWGRAYVYTSPGEVNVDGYDLLTYGADGEEGGDGYNADISHASTEDTTGDTSGTGGTTSAEPAA